MLEYRCLICGETVCNHDVENHKMTHHPSLSHYGLMWPLQLAEARHRDLRSVATYDSAYLAKVLHVRKVYVRDEGMNETGSMKDYLTEHGIHLGRKAFYDSFTAVSSGNHAYSLAHYAGQTGSHSIVFTPATSSKIPMLRCLPRTFVVGVEGAIFEDVYALFSQPGIDELYDVNVSNERLIEGLGTVSHDICRLDVMPTHILSGTGNGSYMAGILNGLQHLGVVLPMAVPVGMRGAFPAEVAHRLHKLVHEHDDFEVEEEHVDAAEGSIATASYSMPQLMHSLRISSGFPLGDLLNSDLAKAYAVIREDEHLMDVGAIPEPTGIMGLAAALKHVSTFGEDDVLLISFTGSAMKDIASLRRLAPENADELVKRARENHSHIGKGPDKLLKGNHLTVTMQLGIDNVRATINAWRESQ